MAIPQPISPLLRASTRRCRMTAGTIRPRSKNPGYGITDAGSKFRHIACEKSGATREIKQGRNNEVSALFHVSWQAVTGRFPILKVVPDLVTRSVAPPPE